MAGGVPGPVICSDPLAPGAHAFRQLVVAAALDARKSADIVVLRIAGVDLELAVADADLGGALLPALRQHIHADAIPTGAAHGDGHDTDTTRMVVWSAPMEPFPWNGGHLGRGGAVAGLSHGPVRATAAADDTSLMLWDAERRIACCWFAGLAGVTRWDRAAPLRTALHFALAGPRRQLVHGAVVGMGGRGVLLAGPGGSGKSTTTLACLQAGMQVVGDDYAAVELPAGPPRAWNLFRSIKVGEREAGPGGRDNRRTLLLGEDLPGSASEMLELSAVLLPRVTGGPHSSVATATSAEALRALAPSTLLQTPYEEQPNMGLLAQLARSVPAYHLNLGADRGVPAIRQVLAA